MKDGPLLQPIHPLPWAERPRRRWRLRLDRRGWWYELRWLVGTVDFKFFELGIREPEQWTSVWIGPFATAAEAMHRPEW